MRAEGFFGRGDREDREGKGIAVGDATAAAAAAAAGGTARTEAGDAEGLVTAGDTAAERRDFFGCGEGATDGAGVVPSGANSSKCASVCALAFSLRMGDMTWGAEPVANARRVSNTRSRKWGH